MQRASQGSVATGIEGIDVPPAGFADGLAFIQAVKSGLSGEVVRQAVDIVGHRELFARLLGTTTGNLSRLYRRKLLKKGRPKRSSMCCVS